MDEKRLNLLIPIISTISLRDASTRNGNIADRDLRNELNRKR